MLLTSGKGCPWQMRASCEQTYGRPAATRRLQQHAGGASDALALARNQGCSLLAWCEPAKNTPNAGGISTRSSPASNPSLACTREREQPSACPALPCPVLSTGLPAGTGLAACLLLQSIRRESARLCMAAASCCAVGTPPALCCMHACRRGVRGSAAVRLEKLRR